MRYCGRLLVALIGLSLIGCDPASIFRDDPKEFLLGRWLVQPPYASDEIDPNNPLIVTFQSGGKWVTSYGRSGEYDLFDSAPSFIRFSNGALGHTYRASWYAGGVGEPADPVQIHKSSDGLEIEIRGSDRGIGPPNGRYAKAGLHRSRVFLDTPVI